MNNVENAELQLSELETLQSIYPNENEVVVEDLYELTVLKQYVESCGAGIAPAKKLNIAINVQLEDVNCILKVECSLPVTYPQTTLPEIFIRYGADMILHSSII